jgi:hypothetical protein
VQSNASCRGDDARIVVVMRVHELRAEVDRKFDEVDRSFDELRQTLVTEGARTRHHFDVVAEQFTSEIRAMVGTLSVRKKLHA